MAAGDISKTNISVKEILGAYLYGSYIYFITAKGDIARYTISGGAIDYPFTTFTYATAADERKVALGEKKITAVCGSTTTMYCGMDDGTIFSVTTGYAVVFLTRLPGKVVALQYASNVLYAVLDNGAVYTVATA
jgi:hypothetical protein